MLRVGVISRRWVRHPRPTWCGFAVFWLLLEEATVLIVKAVHRKSSGHSRLSSRLRLHFESLPMWASVKDRLPRIVSFAADRDFQPEKRRPPSRGLTNRILNAFKQISQHKGEPTAPEDEAERIQSMQLWHDSEIVLTPPEHVNKRQHVEKPTDGGNDPCFLAVDVQWQQRQSPLQRRLESLNTLRDRPKRTGSYLKSGRPDRGVTRPSACEKMRKVMPLNSLVQDFKRRSRRKSNDSMRSNRSSKRQSEGSHKKKKDRSKSYEAPPAPVYPVLTRLQPPPEQYVRSDFTDQCSPVVPTPPAANQPRRRSPNRRANYKAPSSLARTKPEPKRMPVMAVAKVDTFRKTGRSEAQFRKPKRPSAPVQAKGKDLVLNSGRARRYKDSQKLEQLIRK